MPISHQARGMAGPAGMALLAALLAGCAPKYADLKSFVQGHEGQVASFEYVIQPPDVIALSSPTAAELDGEVQQVRSDGKISLKLLGEVEAAGLSPRDLGSKIEELLSRYYVSPSVNVRVVAFESQKLYVFGQVTRPGTLPFTGRDTVLGCVALTAIYWILNAAAMYVLAQGFGLSLGWTPMPARRCSRTSRSGRTATGRTRPGTWSRSRPSRGRRAACLRRSERTRCSSPTGSPAPST